MTEIESRTPLLPEILSLHARWQPEKPALVVGDETITWAEFEVATNRVANGLGALEIGPGDMVAVLMTNGRAMIEVLFGIMKAGACSVPINLSVSDQAVATMIRDSGARALFASEGEAGRIATMAEIGNFNFAGECFAVGQQRHGWTNYAVWESDQSSTFPDINIPHDTPCNVIYSSGTTGLPKGILHSHKGRLDWAYDVALSFVYHSDAMTLCTIGLYSNIMWAAMLCTLLSGGTLVVHESFNAERVLKDIETLSITHTIMVPVQNQRLLEVGATREGLKSLVSAVTVGSKMHRDLKQRMLELMPNALYEIYGLTEGLITIQRPGEVAAKPDSVGRPILGCEILILGDGDRALPAGESGEIAGRARFLMPGYLNQPDETEAAVWIDSQDRKWLRTGDIGYLDDEGSLFVVDRKKDMILSGGQNIYPQDIEDVLAAHEAINDIAVIGAKSHKWGETPIALVVASSDPPVSAEELVKWCNGRVGKQQRIADVIFVDALPRNPNGKLLKRELRKSHGDLEYS